MLRHLSAVTAMAFVVASTAPAPAQPAKAETWLVKKETGGVYPGPGRPLWRLAELKAMHPGQTNWQQLVVDDGRQRATYNSAKPGTVFAPRMHPVSQTMFVIVAGKIRFKLDNQPDIIATRGSIVNVLDSMVYSYEVLDGDTALWVEVDPNNVTDVYPADAPPPDSVGATTKVSFARRTVAYAPPNKAHFNLFDAVAACDAAGSRVKDDHIFASVVMGYANPADNPCPAANDARGGRGRAAAQDDSAATTQPFGHMHTDMAEWWVVQSGGVRAKFGTKAEIHATEGDILYAPLMTWHQLNVEGPGLSSRLAITAFPFINMNSVTE